MHKDVTIWLSFVGWIFLLIGTPKTTQSIIMPHVSPWATSAVNSPVLFEEMWSSIPRRQFRDIRHLLWCREPRLDLLNVKYEEAIRLTSHVSRCSNPALMQIGDKRWYYPMPINSSEKRLSVTVVPSILVHILSAADRHARFRYWMT
jgi:hypothetical protein